MHCCSACTVLLEVLTVRSCCCYLRAPKERSNMLIAMEAERRKLAALQVRSVQRKTKHPTPPPKPSTPFVSPLRFLHITHLLRKQASTKDQTHPITIPLEDHVQQRLLELRKPIESVG
eukprot:3017517-Amphidinium_carterae.1